MIVETLSRYSPKLEGQTESLSSDQEYNSHNTRLLTVDEIKEKLLTLPFIRQELNQIGYLDEVAFAEE